MKRLETWGDELGDNMKRCLDDMKEAYDQLMSAINWSKAEENDCSDDKDVKAQKGEQK